MHKFTRGGRPAYVDLDEVVMFHPPYSGTGTVITLRGGDGWIGVDESVDEVAAAKERHEYGKGR